MIVVVNVQQFQYYSTTKNNGGNYANSCTIIEFEALSTDDKDAFLATLNSSFVGSGLSCVDTGDYYKINMDSTNTTLKWYKQ